MEINLKAPVVIRKKILVKAPVGKIWDLLSDVNQWKYWQPEVSEPVLEGPFVAGSTIRYKVLRVSCLMTLLEVKPMTHLAWSGQSNATTVTGIWNLEEVPEGVWVKADSSFEGRQAWATCWLLYPLGFLTIWRCLRKLRSAAEKVQ